MDQTLLENFIERKKNAYPTPLKGLRNRFSRKKYLATLYALTSDKQITTAMELGVSYGLLRKWKTEGHFRAVVRRHCEEFAEDFIKHILQKRDDTIRDIGSYSHELLAGLLKGVVGYAQGLEKEGAYLEAFSLLSAFLRITFPSVGEKAMAEISRVAGIDLFVLARGMKLGAIERVKEILSRPHITDAGRKEAVSLLGELGAII